MLITINYSFIYIEFDIFYINSYIGYILYLLKTIIIKHNLKINVIFGNINYNFNNNNKLIRLNINWEHTLVKNGARELNYDYKIGNVHVNSKENYLVRLERYNELICSDIIIEYSIPNIYNLYKSNFYNEIYNKMLYISPMIFDYNINNYCLQDRSINILTKFVRLNQPRRQELIQRFNLSKLDHKNINDCYDIKQLEELYLKTKILVNIHQTEHHHTFEELRVLPALLTGVIVISETSPLSNLIPYNDLILWCSYDNIIELVNKVLSNYKFFHDKIFSSNKHLLQKLNNNNLTKLENKLLE